ncbi:hypothetical protein PINS_up004253 [Pythium insidiosum]|nr:hypothetical protein PINS_up004253 [Pythium insidiosum]
MRLSLALLLLLLLLLLCSLSHWSDASRAVFYASGYLTTTPPPPSGINVSAENASDWYTEDHPYLYVFSKMRAPNGSMVPNPSFNATELSWHEVRRNISASMPSFMHYLFSEKAVRLMRRADKFAIYGAWAPFDEDKDRVFMRQKIKTMFFQFAPHKKLISFIGNAIMGKIKTKVRKTMQKFDMERMWSGTPEERRELLNLTEAEYNELHSNLPNRTMRYMYAEIFWPPFAPHFQRFQPMPHYNGLYYDNPELRAIPPPTLPAPVYPWPWRRHLDMTRAMLLPIMEMLRQEFITEEAKFQAKEAARFARDNAAIMARRDAAERAQHKQLVLDSKNESWDDKLDGAVMAGHTDMLGSRRLRRLMDRLWDAWANGATQETPAPSPSPSPTPLSSRSSSVAPRNDGSGKSSGGAGDDHGDDEDEDDEDDYDEDDEDEDEEEEEEKEEPEPPAVSARMRLARRLIEEHSSRFHFITGIPRLLDIQDIFEVLVFPSPSDALQFHLNLTIKFSRSLTDPKHLYKPIGWRHPEDHRDTLLRNGTALNSSSSSNADGSFGTNSLLDGSLDGSGIEASLNETSNNEVTPLPPDVYEAMKQFYAFPVVRDRRVLDTNRKYSETLAAIARKTKNASLPSTASPELSAPT